jgi:hypothetical protein
MWIQSSRFSRETENRSYFTEFAPAIVGLANPESGGQKLSSKRRF